MYSLTFFLSFKIWYIIWLYYKWKAEPIWHRSTRSKSSYIKVNFVFWNFFIHNSHPFCLLGRALFYGPCSPFLLSRGRNFINKNILMLYKLRKKDEVIAWNFIKQHKNVGTFACRFSCNLNRRIFMTSRPF